MQNMDSLQLAECGIYRMQATPILHNIL